jgi:2-oxoglutarate ferredoxin oxidoreductase subunit delta
MSVAYKVFSYEGEKGSWSVFPRLCKGCGLCKEKCPEKCLSWSLNLGVYGTPAVEPKMDECTVCGFCASVCPDCAIIIVKKKK